MTSIRTTHPHPLTPLHPSTAWMLLLLLLIRGWPMRRTAEAATDACAHDAGKGGVAYPNPNQEAWSSSKVPTRGSLLAHWRASTPITTQVEGLDEGIDDVNCAGHAMEETNQKATCALVGPTVSLSSLSRHLSSSPPLSCCSSFPHLKRESSSPAAARAQPPPYRGQRSR